MGPPSWIELFRCMYVSVSE